MEEISLDEISEDINYKSITEIPNEKVVDQQPETKPILINNIDTNTPENNMALEDIINKKENILESNSPHDVDNIEQNIEITPLDVNSDPSIIESKPLDIIETPLIDRDSVDFQKGGVKEKKKRSGYRVGDKVEIRMIDSSHKYNLTSGIVICYNNDELIIQPGDLDNTSDKIKFNLSDGDISKEHMIDSIDVTEESSVSNYLELIGIEINRKVRLHMTDNEDINHLQVGTVINITDNGNITIEFDKKNIMSSETNRLDINLENGLTSINNIDKIELITTEGLSQQLSDFEDFGITFDDEELEEITQEVEIAEDERTYPEEEEFESIFQNLINEFTKRENFKHRHVKTIEDKISALCFKLILLKRTVNQRYQDTNSYKKSPRYRRLIDMIKRGESTEFIRPIVKNTIKSYKTTDLLDDDEEKQDLFLKEFNDYEALTKDFESGGKNFIDYKQGADQLFNCVVTDKQDSQKGYKNKIKQDLEVLYDISNPTKVFRSVSDYYYQNENEKYIPYLYGDQLEIIGMMSLPNFMNCWEGLHPNMTLSQKSKCRMVPLNFAYQESLDKNLFSSQKLVFDQKVSFVYNDQVRKGSIIHYHSDGLIVQLDETELEEGEDENDENNEILISKQDILRFQVGDKVNACITIEDDKFNKKIQTIRGIVKNITPVNIYLLESNLEEELVLPWTTEIWKASDNIPCPSDIEKGFIQYLFPTHSSISDNQYELLLEQIIPTAGDAFARGWLDSSNLTSIHEIESKLARYYIFLDELPNYQSEEILQTLQENISVLNDRCKQEWDIYHNQIIQLYLKSLDKKSDKKEKKGKIEKKEDILDIDKYGKIYNPLGWVDHHTTLDNHMSRFQWFSRFADQGLLPILNYKREKFLLEWTPEKIENEISKCREKEDSLKTALAKINSDLTTLSDQSKWFGHHKKIVKIYHSKQDLEGDNDKDIFVDSDRDPVPKYSSDEIQENGGLDKLLERDFPHISGNDRQLIKEQIPLGGTMVKSEDQALLINQTEGTLYKRINPGGGGGLWIRIRDINDRSEIEKLINEDLSIEGKQIPKKNHKISLLEQKKITISNSLSEISQRIKYIRDITNIPKKLEQKILYWNQYYKSIPIRAKNINQYESNRIKKISKDLGLTKKNEKSLLEKKIIQILGKSDTLERDYLMSQLIKSPQIREGNSSQGELSYMFYDVTTDKPVLSRHWELKSQLSINPKNRNRNLKKLIDNYGVREEGSEWIVCKYDGDRLSKIDLDTKEGFEDEGVHKKTREYLDIDITIPNLKKILGISTSVENVILETTFELSKAMYIQLDLDHFKQCIPDIYKIISSINGDEWCRKVLNDQIKHKKINENDFRKKPLYKKKINSAIYASFEKYQKQIILYTIAARLLILLQTSIPEFEIYGVHPSCVYSIAGYPLDIDDSHIGKENHGIIFLSTLLKYLSKSTREDKSSDARRFEILQNEKKETIIRMITKQIELFYRKPSIKKLYTIKKEYTKRLAQKNTFLSEFGLRGLKSFLPNRNGQHLKETKLDSRKAINIEKIYNRQKWLAKQLLNSILSKYKTYDIILTDAQKRPLHENVCNYIQITNTINLDVPDKNGDFEEIGKLSNNLANIKTIHLSISDVVYNIRNENVLCDMPSSKEISSVFINFCYKEPFIGIPRVTSTDGKCLITRTKSDAFNSGVSIKQRSTIWENEGNDCDSDSYSKYLKYVTEQTQFKSFLTESDEIKTYSDYNCLVEFLPTEMMELLNTVKIDEVLPPEVSQLIDIERREILDIDPKFEIICRENTDFYWNSLIGQFINKIACVNQKHYLSKKNVDIWQFTDDNYTKFTKEMKKLEHSFPMERINLEHIKQCQTVINKCAYPNLLLQYLCLRFVRITTNLNIDIRDDEDFDNPDLQIEGVELNLEKLQPREEQSIVNMLLLVLEESNIISDDIIKSSIEQSREREKQEFIKRKDDLTDEAREVDNDMQKYQLGKWSKENYDYWNDDKILDNEDEQLNMDEKPILSEGDRDEQDNLVIEDQSDEEI